MPTSALVYAPTLVTVRLQRIDNTRLPLASPSLAWQTRSFGELLRPGEFSAQARSTSELLRIL